VELWFAAGAVFSLRSSCDPPNGAAFSRDVADEQRLFTGDVVGDHLHRPVDGDEVLLAAVVAAELVADPLK
jgi:hypothetical protein